MLSVKQGGIKYHFLSLWSPGPLANTLTPRPMSGHSFYRLPLIPLAMIMHEKLLKIRTILKGNKEWGNGTGQKVPPNFFYGTLPTVFWTHVWKQDDLY